MYDECLSWPAGISWDWCLVPPGDIEQYCISTSMPSQPVIGAFMLTDIVFILMLKCAILKEAIGRKFGVYKKNFICRTF